jgi:hypothetical protein
MDPEEVWRSLPVRLQNLCLGIAREYGHGWSNSSAVPKAGEWWEEPEQVPSLAEIESGTPEGPCGKGIASPCLTGEGGMYYITHRTSTGRVLLIVRYSEQGGEFYTVRVSRPNGGSAWGSYAVDRGEFVELSADRVAWGARHFAAWSRAWSVFGLSPEFPGSTLGWTFYLTSRGIPKDGRLEFATVHVQPGAHVNAQDLYDCVRGADSVFVHGENGGVVRLVAQD